jgi:N-acetylglucosamine-6-sulfatase
MEGYVAFLYRIKGGLRLLGAPFGTGVRRWSATTIACVICGLMLAACGGGSNHSAGNQNTIGSGSPQGLHPPPGPYNFVLVLTDDQRAGTTDSDGPQRVTDAMPLLRARLEAHGGVDFTSTYVTTPLCCPSRAGFHAGGQYAHTTGFLSVSAPLGGIDVFRDDRTLARLLQDKGYSTFFAGKYFVTYSSKGVYQHAWPYVPPGWTRWFGRASFATGNSDWNNFNYILGSSGDSSSVGTSQFVHQYTMDYEGRQALDFIDQAKSRPFYLFLATTAPHEPATPASTDLGKYGSFQYDRPSLHDDVSNKPAWVARWPTKNTPGGMTLVRHQLESLQAVDRAVAAIIDKLAALGILDRTLFVFTSDNGYMWGEHGVWEKGVAYEESVRVPLAIIPPGASGAPRQDDSLVAANLDIPATIADYAGIDLTAGGTRHGTDGLSLKGVLERPGTALGRKNLLLEEFGYSNDAYGLWAATVQHDGAQKWKYVYYPGSREEELYDLVADPYEMNNLQNSEAYAPKKAELKAYTDQHRALAVRTFAVPAGTVGQPYQAVISASGGVPPYNYAWSVDPLYPLPSGLTVAPDPADPQRAIISGIPQRAVCRQQSIIDVEDVQQSAGAPETDNGRGQKYPMRYWVTIQNSNGTSPCTGSESSPPADREL